MKCQNCEKEAVFFYRENVNGSVTETCLCGECAEKAGFLRNGYMRTDNLFGSSLFDEFDSLMSGIRRFPSRLFRGFPLTSASGEDRALPKQTPVTAIIENKTVEMPPVDESIRKRRELNELRERMRTAAQSEDFETAARLRDEIRAIEGGA